MRLFLVASERLRSSTIRASACEAPRSLAVSNAHPAISFIHDHRTKDDIVIFWNVAAGFVEGLLGAKKGVWQPP
jgi:hypothetical protein